MQVSMLICLVATFWRIVRLSLETRHKELEWGKGTHKQKLRPSTHITSV